MSEKLLEDYRPSLFEANLHPSVLCIKAQINLPDLSSSSKFYFKIALPLFFSFWDHILCLGSILILFQSESIYILLRLLVYVISTIVFFAMQIRRAVLP